MRKIDPSEYMIDGWDQQSYPSYRRGSLHNKVGMTIMWTYYLITNCFIISGVIRHWNDL